MKIVYLKDAIKKLEDQSYYPITVSLFEGNPPFKAILYTGFTESTGYQAIFCTGGSAEEIVPSRYPNALVKIYPKIIIPGEGDKCFNTNAWGIERKYNKHGKLKGSGK